LLPTLSDITAPIYALIAAKMLFRYSDTDIITFDTAVSSLPTRRSASQQRSGATTDAKKHYHDMPPTKCHDIPQLLTVPSQHLAHFTRRRAYPLMRC